MSIATESSQDGQALTIKIKGRFDFSAHQDFRKAYQSAEHKPKKYIIDMQETTYLDSSALGMLLLLHDHVSSQQAGVHIINSSDNIKRLLAISSFDRLFVID